MDLNHKVIRVGRCLHMAAGGAWAYEKFKCLAVASGLWLGKEGPLVHVACCCANLLMKLSPTLNENEGNQNESYTIRDELIGISTQKRGSFSRCRRWYICGIRIADRGCSF